MSEEIKKTEKIEKVGEAAELAEVDLENVAGGKTYLRTRSNTSSVPAPAPAPIARPAVPKTVEAK